MITETLLLFLATCLALVIDNTSLSWLHQSFIHTSWIFNHTLLNVVNDGLMVIFFIMISLELKREFIDGELSDIKKILLPAFAAFGGMIVPALIYILINLLHPETLRGWAIPVATDIAFALGVLSLFSKRIPNSLKLFLMSLAVFDDLGAILIIAFFHSVNLNTIYLLASLVIFITLVALNYFRFKNLLLYGVVGLVFWFCILHSGIHATIAGVLFGLIIPNQEIHRLENKLKPLVYFVILPLFAFANAGFSLDETTFFHLFDSVTMGIFMGLFLGKQIGVMAFTYLLVKSGYTSLPEKATWHQVYGVALLCGIGFTMSLFLGTLTFAANGYMNEVKLGVLLGSTLSAICGGLVLIKKSATS